MPPTMPYVYPVVKTEKPEICGRYMLKVRQWHGPWPVKPIEFPIRLACIAQRYDYGSVLLLIQMSGPAFTQPASTDVISSILRLLT